MQESSSSNPPRPRTNYASARLNRVLDNTSISLIEEVKKLSISMDKADDDETWKKLRDQRDDAVDQIAFVAQASAEHVGKLQQLEETSTTPKRGFDAVEKESGGEPSKKNRLSQIYI